MTSRENFLAMMAGGMPAWLPYDVPATAPVVEAIRRETGMPPEDAFDADFRNVDATPRGDDPARWRRELEKAGFRYPPGEIVTGPFGLAWRRPPVASLGSATHMLEMLHPLEVIEDVAELEALPWPDTADPAHYEDFPARCGRIHGLGKVASGLCEGTIFEFTWYVRGMDNVFCDWAEENPVSEWLMDYFTRRSIHKCRAMVRAGCDVIRLGDDVGTQQSLLLSIDQWRHHLKPRLKAVIDAIREASEGRRIFVQYHSDGAITPLIPDLIEIGVDILNPVQPECMDVAAVAAEFGDRIALCGMIGTQTTMPFGSVQDVREAVDAVRDLHRRGARVVVAPTHVLEPDVPLENIRAFVEAARQPIW
jgi:uroporphyrinogen decarboxylase